jgi:integrative and conjugative element protein (TIGR02256 family)
MTPQLFVHQDVVGLLTRVPARPCEVGGWLLGYWTHDDSSVVITHATPPASQGTPFGVHISGKGHRGYFNDAWHASGGAVTFLGDWHTHPGCPPLPSARDRSALTKLATDAAYGTPTPLMAILSTPRWPWQPRALALRFYLRGTDGEVRDAAPEMVSAMPEEARAVPRWEWPARRVRAARGNDADMQPPHPTSPHAAQPGRPSSPGPFGAFQRG